MATQVVKKVSEAKPSVLQPMLYKSVVTVYRIFAIVTLYVVLAGVVAYGFVMGFYAINTSWAGPVILSPADDKSLDFTEKLVTTRQTLEDLNVDMKKLQDGVGEMTKHRTALEALQPELSLAIAREQQHNRTTGPELLELDQQKLADNLKTQKVLAQVKEVEAAIDKDLAAGLITKGDAATQRAALNQVQSSYTDSKIGEILLTDNILEKTTTDTKTLDVLDKQAELISEIAQLDIAIGVAQKQMYEETKQITRLKEALATAKQTPYYFSVYGNNAVNFAFVPYDNQSNASIGSCGLRLLPEYGRVQESRHSEADLCRRRTRHPSHLQDRHPRLPHPDAARPSRIREIEDRVPEPQTAFLLIFFRGDATMPMSKVTPEVKLEPFRGIISAGFAIALLLVPAAFAADANETNDASNRNKNNDQQAYCRYLTEQAAAQRDLLMTPDAVAGVTQPNTGLPMQVVWGVSGSLSSVRKGVLTMDAARKNCELYTATTSTQQDIQYALPSLEKQALQHRLDADPASLR